MYPVKQSTSLTIPVFAHDANGDAVTGLLNAGFTKRISKNGAAFGAMTVTITEMENGFYSLPLDTGHTDTTGILTIILTHASCKQINIQLRVHARILDDLTFPNVSGRGIDVDATGGVEITANQNVNINQWLTATPNVLIAGRVDANTQAMANNVITSSVIATDAIGAAQIAANAIGAAEIADGAIDAATFAAGAIDAAAIATDAIGSTEFSQAAADKVWSSASRTLTAFSFAVDISAAAVTLIWDKATSGLTTVGSIGKLLVDNINATISSRSSHSAADVWTSGTRTLTSFGTLITDIWASVSRTITGGTITTNSDKTGYSLTSAEETAIADALLKRDMSAVTGEAARSPLNALRFLRNKWTVAAGTLTVTKEDDTATAWTGAVTSDPAADPITGTDPA